MSFQVEVKYIVVKRGNKENGQRREGRGRTVKRVKKGKEINIYVFEL